MDLHGKVIMVTGATAGIGMVTARVLASQGAVLVGVGRSAQKCADTAQEIRRASGNPQVEFLVADLSAQVQIHRLAEAFLTRYDRLDVLVNNAGGFFNARQLSADGIEMSWALNHLNYFLLTNLLLEKIKASAPARIVNVSSDAHQGCKRLNFEDLEMKNGYSGWPAYSQSKLANVMFTYELARRLEGSGVTVNALHPGFVATNFGHNNGSWMKAGIQLVQKMVARPVEKGAETSIYLASSPEVAGVTGKYFTDCRPVQSSPASYDSAAARRLWEVSAQTVKIPA